MQGIQPVLLGADMNCYSVARAFHEAYGVVSHAFGRWAMGETKYSRIVKVTLEPRIDEEAVMLERLAQYARQHPDVTRILMGCTDDYAAMIIRNRDTLAKDFIVPYIDAALMERLVSKEVFYRYCEDYDIPYPATVVMHGMDEVQLLDALPFSWPVILKPSSSIEYWKHPFEGMKKAYTAANVQEAREIAGRIFGAGYGDSLIVQDLIPGADDGMRVLTAYSDRDARVRMVCLGHVLLEEHTPKAIGNPAAILTEHNRPLMEKIAAFLEDIGYLGFSNFDIKLDPRDGQYKVFEINLRQGRTNYYVTGAGLNIARYVVQDRVLQQDLGEPVYFSGESYWHSIPNKIVWQYTADADAVKQAQALAAQGKGTTTLAYKFDMRWNPLRCLYLWEHSRRYHKKYATYCPKPKR